MHWYRIGTWYVHVSYVCVCISGLCHIYKDMQLCYCPYGRGTFSPTKQLRKHVSVQCIILFDTFCFLNVFMWTVEPCALHNKAALPAVVPWARSICYFLKLTRFDLFCSWMWKTLNAWKDSTCSFYQSHVCELLQPTLSVLFCDESLFVFEWVKCSWSSKSWQT